MTSTSGLRAVAALAAAPLGDEGLTDQGPASRGRSGSLRRLGRRPRPLTYLSAPLLSMAAARARRVSRAPVIEEVLLIAGASEPDVWKDSVRYPPLR